MPGLFSPGVISCQSGRLSENDFKMRMLIKIELAALLAGFCCLTGALAEEQAERGLFHFDAANLPEGGASREAFGDAAKNEGGVLREPLALSLSDPEAVKLETIQLDPKMRALRIQLPKPAEGKTHNSVSLTVQDGEMGSAVDPDKPLNIELKFRRTVGGMSLNSMLIFVHDSVRTNLSLGGFSLSADEGGMFLLPAAVGEKPAPAGQIPPDELVTLTLQLIEAAGGLSLSVKAVVGPDTLFDERVVPQIPPPVGETSSEGRPTPTLNDLRGIMLTASVQAISGDLIFLDIVSFRAWQ